MQAWVLLNQKSLIAVKSDLIQGLGRKAWTWLGVQGHFSELHINSLNDAPTWHTILEGSRASFPWRIQLLLSPMDALPHWEGSMWAEAGATCCRKGTCCLSLAMCPPQLGAACTVWVLKDLRRTPGVLIQLGSWSQRVGRSTWSQRLANIPRVSNVAQIPPHIRTNLLPQL